MCISMIRRYNLDCYLGLSLGKELNVDKIFMSV